jgi:protein-tyrosine phosphatase
MTATRRIGAPAASTRLPARAARAQPHARMLASMVDSIHRQSVERDRRACDTVQPMSEWFEHFGFAEVGENLLMGAYPQDAQDVGALADAGVTRIFNLVQDVEYDAGARDTCVAALAAVGIDERRVELVDFGSVPPEQIEAAAQTVLAWLDEGERVYVHCRAGWQRSATVVTAIVALREGVLPNRALELLRVRKPTANPLSHQLADLLDWWRLRER